IRFRVNDGHATGPGPYVVSDEFVVDNKIPTAPSVISYAGKKTKNSLSLFLGTPSSDDHFYRYALYYSPSVTDPYEDGTSEWNQSNDPHLGFEDFGGASSTTVTGLIEDTTYYFRLYVYDQYGNANYSPQAFGIKTNDPPVVSAVQGNPRKDTSGKVDIAFTGYDNDSDTCTYVDYQYISGFSYFDMTPSTSDLLHTQTLRFSPAGSPTLFVWDSRKELNNQEREVFGYIKVSDGIEEASGQSAVRFWVDNLGPRDLSNFNVSEVRSTRILLEWNTVTDQHFSHYEVWYGTSPGVERDTHTYLSKEGIPKSGELVESTSIEDLVSGWTYYLKVFAIDTYGNVSESAELEQLTAGGPEVSFPDESEIYQR
ncbi:MAG TPA: fibronectin type III domain-containing protein, partial [bacterium]|nr:fibronectin type III domain-containing protein [bacterium]